MREKLVEYVKNLFRYAPKTQKNLDLEAEILARAEVREAAELTVQVEAEAPAERILAPYQMQNLRKISWHRAFQVIILHL